MTAQPAPRLANPSTASAAHSDAPRDAARDADTLPQAIEAEQQLLGAILLNNETYDRIAHIINPSHFHDPVHAHIFELIANRIAKGNLASPITLRPFLEGEDALKDRNAQGGRRPPL